MDKLKSKLKKLKQEFVPNGSTKFQGTARTLGTAEPKAPIQRPVTTRPQASTQDHPTQQNTTSTSSPSRNNHRPSTVVAAQPTSSGAYEPPPEATEEIQAAISLLATSPNSAAASDVLYKLLRNIVNSPDEEKYRKIRLNNPKIASTVVETDGGVELLLACGFDIEFPSDKDSPDSQPQDNNNNNTPAAVESEGFAVLSTFAELGPLKSALPLLLPLIPYDNTKSLSAATKPAPTQPAAAQQQQQQQPAVVKKKEREWQPARPRNTTVILPTSVQTDVPSWFFDRTGGELKSLFISAAKKRETEQMLITKATRERLAAKSRLPPADHAVIKVRLPEGLSFQGEFNPGEPIVAVFGWVADCLHDPLQTFDLIQPDRKPLQVAEKSVKEMGMLPSVTLNLRWTGHSAVAMKEMPALRSDLLRSAATGAG